MADAAPLGTIHIKVRSPKQIHLGFVSIEQEDGTLLVVESIRCVARWQKFVKKSHRGTYRKRWVPFSRYWWENNVAPIPPGYLVFHRDGNPLNDCPWNLVLCRDRGLSVILRNPDAASRQRVNRRKALRRSNPLRAREMRSVRSAMLEPESFYPILHGLKRIVVTPCKSPVESTLLRSSLASSLAREGKDERQCMEWFAVNSDPSLWKIEFLTGNQILRLSQYDGPLEEYRRYVVNERELPKKKRQAISAESLLSARITPVEELSLGGIHCGHVHSNEHRNSSGP